MIVLIFLWLMLCVFFIWVFDQHRKWRLLAGKLADQLQKHHSHQSESLVVYFEQDGKPIDISTDLGEAYQESSMCADTSDVLAEYRSML